MLEHDPADRLQDLAAHLEQMAQCLGFHVAGPHGLGEADARGVGLAGQRPCIIEGCMITGHMAIIPRPSLRRPLHPAASEPRHAWTAGEQATAKPCRRLAAPPRLARAGLGEGARRWNEHQDETCAPAHESLHRLFLPSPSTHSSLRVETPNACNSGQ